MLIKKAVIWLAKTLNKPILKLTENDYNNNGMAQLATQLGPVYNINISIFSNIQHTITGWPGGKFNADDSVSGPNVRTPAVKSVPLFSHHTLMMM
jgi:glucosamine-6-phosphate deaminase